MKYLGEGLDIKKRVRMWEIDAYFGSTNRSLLLAFSVIQQTLPFYKKVGENKLINSNSTVIVRVAGLIR